MQVENEIEACQVKMIASDSLQMLIAKFMNEMEKHKYQIKKTHDKKVCDMSISEIHLKNATRFHESEVESLEKCNSSSFSFL